MPRINVSRSSIIRAISEARAARFGTCPRIAANSAFAVVLAVYLAAAICQALLLPAFEGPDEQRHYAYARFLLANGALPPRERPAMDYGHSYIVGQMSGNPPLYYAMAALAMAPIQDADSVASFTRFNPYFTGFSVYGLPNDNHNHFLHGVEDAFPWRGPALAVRLGRLVSVLLGALTLLAVYAAGREFDPGGALGVLAAAAVACIPQWLFVQSALSNDAAVIAFASLGLWLALRVARRGTTFRAAVMAGLIGGLCGLSKINGSWIALIMLIALVARAPSPSAAFRAASIQVGITALLVGPWLAWGLITNSDATGMSMHTLSDESLLSISPSAIAQLSGHIASAEYGFWYNAGWAGLIPGPEWLYPLYRIVFGTGSAIAIFLVGYRAARRSLAGPRALAAALIGLTIIFATMGFAYWVLVLQWSIGRLLYPGIAAFALVTAFGWRSMLQFGHPPLRAALGATLLTILFAGLIAGPVTTLSALLPRADLKRGPDTAKTATRITFLDPSDRATPVAVLTGFNMAGHGLAQGRVMFADLCWKATGYRGRVFPYSIQVVAGDNARLGDRSSFHGLGSYPQSAWADGEEFCDPTALRITLPVERTQSYDVLVTLFDGEPGTTTYGRALQALDGAGRPIERTIVGSVRVAAPNPIQAMAPPIARFGDAIRLNGWSVGADGGGPKVTLQWQALRDGSRDLKVFFYSRDVDGRIVASSDHRPDRNRFPTNIWEAGDVIEDVFTLDMPGSSPLSELEYLVGLYDEATGTREPAVNLASGLSAPDNAVLMP